MYSIGSTHFSKEEEEEFYMVSSYNGHVVPLYLEHLLKLSLFTSSPTVKPDAMSCRPAWMHGCELSLFSLLLSTVNFASSLCRGLIVALLSARLRPWLAAAVIRSVPVTAGSMSADYLVTDFSSGCPLFTQPAHVQLLLLRCQLQKASVPSLAGSHDRA